MRLKRKQNLLIRIFSNNGKEIGVRCNDGSVERVKRERHVFVLFVNGRQGVEAVCESAWATDLNRFIYKTGLLRLGVCDVNRG